jgi:hypothetical protein
MNAQSELQFTMDGGGSYQVGTHAATWQRRANDEKIVDLSFRGKRFEVTREGSGPGGRPRMFINGIRTPDGKLFQGRSLTELVRKLARHFDDFVEIPARLQRMERKLDTLLAARRPSKTKLCLALMTATWPQERYIPKAALGGFARVPIPIIAASQCMAAGEYRLLQAVLFCAQGSGLLTAGKNRLAKLAKVGEAHVKHYIRSLCNRLILRPTGRIARYGVREHELLTHPWLIEDHENGGQQTASGGQICAGRGTTVVPLKTNGEDERNRERNRESIREGKSDQKTPPEMDKFTRSYCEEELLGLLSRYLKPSEIIQNGPMWRGRIKVSAKAIIEVIKLYHGLSPEKRSQIRNPAAWFTDQYASHGGKPLSPPPG